MHTSGTPGSVTSTHSNPDSVIAGQSAQKTGNPISVSDSKAPGSMPSTSGITDSSEHWNSGGTPFSFAMTHDHAMPRDNSKMKQACKVNQDIIQSAGNGTCVSPLQRVTTVPSQAQA